MIIDRREGYTEVIAGGMYSGKTGAMLHKLEKFDRGYKAKVARENGGNGEVKRGVSLVFRPSIDDRKPETHCGRYTYDPIAIDAERPSDLLRHINFDVCQAIGIDEAQFIKNAEELIHTCYYLNSIGICVIIAGLDLTWDLRPFGAMPSLMSHFHVEQIFSVCWRCGYRFARLSERIVSDTGEILVSEAVDDDTYKPCCQACHPIAKERVYRFFKEGAPSDIIVAEPS